MAGPTTQKGGRLPPAPGGLSPLTGLPLSRNVGALRHTYMLYEMWTGLYMLDAWEKRLFSACPRAAADLPQILWVMSIVVKAPVGGLPTLPW